MQASAGDNTLFTSLSSGEVPEYYAAQRVTLTQPDEAMPIER